MTHMPPKALTAIKHFLANNNPDAAKQFVNQILSGATDYTSDERTLLLKEASALDIPKHEKTVFKTVSSNRQRGTNPLLNHNLHRPYAIWHGGGNFIPHLLRKRPVNPRRLAIRRGNH